MNDFTDEQLRYLCDLVIDDTVKKLDRRGVIGETFDIMDAELKRREQLKL